MNTTSDVVYAFAVAVSLTGAAFTQLAGYVPKTTSADYYEVRSITAHRQGDTAVLSVDRIIKQEVPMSYAVRVFQIDDRGAHLLCEAEGGPIMYRRDAVLPDPVTLKWWTNGHCQKIPPGIVEIDTTWTPRLPGLLPVSVTVGVMD